MGPQGHSTLTKRLAFRATGAPRVLHATLRAKSAPRVWKGATEEGARWGTLKSLHWGSRGQSKDGTLEGGRAFVNSHGHPLRRSTQYGDTYAPEGMGPRSGVHDGKGARKGHSCQRTHKVAFLHRMTPRAEGCSVEREPEGSCKVLFPEGRGRHCWKSDETGRFVRPPRGRPG